MPAYIACVFTLVAIFQGSLGSICFLVAGVALAVPLFALRDNVRFRVNAAPLLLLALWMVAASLACGFSAESLSVSMLGLSLLAAYLCIDALHPYDKEGVSVGVCFGGAVIAIMGVLSFAGVLNIGWLDGKHLVYGFGDSNVAAAYLAACTLLCQKLIERNRFLTLATPFCVVGMLLTCSVIVIALWLVAQAVILFTQRGNKAQVGQLILIFTAMVFGVAIYFLQPIMPATVALLVALLAWAWFAETPLEKLSSTPVIWVLAVVTIAGVIAGAAFSQRLQVETPLMLTAALIEMGDGVSCMFANLPFGIGAGQWSYLFPYYQSTVYGSTVVPDGFIHLGAESGVVVFACAAICAACALESAARQGVHSIVAGIILVAASLFTAALSAYAFSALLILLACLPRRQENSDEEGKETEGEELQLPGFKVPVPATFVAAAVLCIACALGCFGIGQVQLLKGSMVNEDADAADVCSAYASQPYWVQNSPAIRVLYTQWVSYEVINETSEGYAVGQQAESLLGTMTQWNLYDYVAMSNIYGKRYEFDQGLQYLLDAAKRAPHYRDIYTNIQLYIESADVSDELAQEAVDLAAENGCTIDYTPLTDDEKKLFDDAKKDFEENYTSSDSGSDEQ